MSEIILPKFMNIGGGKIKSVTDILKIVNATLTGTQADIRTGLEDTNNEEK